MIEFVSGAWLYVTAIIAAVILAISLLRIKDMEKKEQAFVAAGLAAGLLLFSVENPHPLIIIALAIGILNFNGLLSGSDSKKRTIYVTLSLLYIALIHWVGFVLIAQAMLIGILSGITSIKEYKNGIENKKVEINRDFFHVAAGVLLMSIFYFESISIAITLQILMILGGLFVISMTETFKTNRLSGSLYRLERNGASLGHGALWLALGSLFAVSFLNTAGILAVFSALFIGDPIATMIGIHKGKRKLPYNHRKSIAGTLAYFVVTAVVSSVFIGAYGIVVGLVGSIVESMKTRIDDNFSVSVVLTLLLSALGI
ncbi:MAG: diacylglycerol/polyprenol kinase family protein [Candidatus Micrarchaeaceae archaeon]